MPLFAQNIDGAREAGQKDAQLFMEKLRNACQKFAKVTAVSTLEATKPLVIPPEARKSPIIDV